MKGQTIWITGLSGSGKSTYARNVARITGGIVLDADEIRTGLNADLGFGWQDRAENVRRIGEVALLLALAGHVVIVAAISPGAHDRTLVRKRHEELGLKFTLIYMSTPVDVCEARDAKGLYAKARDGQIKEFAGISLHYEVPESPEITI